MSKENDTMKFQHNSKLNEPKDKLIHKQEPLHSGPEQDNHADEDEPLFVEDRTSSFKLPHAIIYENPDKRAKKSKFDNTGLKQNSCWNCESVSHSLHSCPEPRNPEIINQNRQVFIQQKQQNSGAKNKRYNNDRKNERYFVASDRSLCSGFTPGNLSDELREALGVPENGIPLHVYKMREYGYPSGWLEESKEEYSRIAIYTSPNECLPFPGSENVGESNNPHCGINERKLHKYPGFNAPCPPGAVDEFKEIGCPEFNPDQNLKNMIESLKSNQIKNKLTEPENSGINEVEDLPSNSTGKSTEDESLHTESNIVENNKSPSSPEDGEITEDEENDKETSSDTTEVTGNEETINEKTMKITDEQNISNSFDSCVGTKESLNDTQLSLYQSITSESESPSLPMSSKRKFGDVKSEILGTPVLKRFSSYENRPNHESFAKGMVDIVDHENLPNAVGTFKKIKDILNDVRKTLNNLL